MRKDGRRSQGMASAERTDRIYAAVDGILAVAKDMRQGLSRDQIERMAQPHVRQLAYRTSAKCQNQLRKQYETLLPLVKQLRDSLE
jgi:hypothetical protein